VRGTVYRREHGIAVIDGGCLLMFEPAADFRHKVMRMITGARYRRPFVPRMARL
jgi:hypothetical protein